MTVKTVFAGLLLAVAMAAAWRHLPLDRALWEAAARPAPEAAVPRPSVVSMRSWHEAAVQALQSVTPSGAQAPVQAVHRCIGGATVLYTDEDCPAGTRRAALDSGTFTVVSGSRRDVDEGRPRSAAPAGERFKARAEAPALDPA